MFSVVKGLFTEKEPSNEPTWFKVDYDFGWTVSPREESFLKTLPIGTYKTGRKQVGFYTVEKDLYFKYEDDALQFKLTFL